MTSIILFFGMLLGMYIEAAYALYLGSEKNAKHLFNLPTIWLAMMILSCLIQYWTS